MVAPSASVGPRPLVLVIHNYQGLKQFDRDVAEYLLGLVTLGWPLICTAIACRAKSVSFRLIRVGSRHFKQMF